MEFRASHVYYPQRPPSPPLACLTEQDTPTRATFTSVQTSSSMFSEIEVFRVFQNLANYVLHFWRRAQSPILGRKPGNVLSLPPTLLLSSPTPLSTLTTAQL